MEDPSDKYSPEGQLEVEDYIVAGILMVSLTIFIRCGGVENGIVYENKDNIEVKSTLIRYSDGKEYLLILVPVEHLFSCEFTDVHEVMGKLLKIELVKYESLREGATFSYFNKRRILDFVSHIQAYCFLNDTISNAECKVYADNLLVQEVPESHPEPPDERDFPEGWQHGLWWEGDDTY